VLFREFFQAARQWAAAQIPLTLLDANSIVLFFGKSGALKDLEIHVRL